MSTFDFRSTFELGPTPSNYQRRWPIQWEGPTWELVDRLPEVPLSVVLAKTVHGPVLDRVGWPDIWPHGEARYREDVLDAPTYPRATRPDFDLGPAPGAYRRRWPIDSVPVTIKRPGGSETFMCPLVTVDEHPIRLRGKRIEVEAPTITSGDLIGLASQLTSADRLPRGDRPVELGHSVNGTRTVRAFPVKVNGHEDRRLCRGRVWMKFEPGEIDPSDPELIGPGRLIRCDADHPAAQLHACGKPLVGKRRQARYCDDCNPTVQNTNTRARARHRQGQDEWAAKVDNAPFLDELRAMVPEVPEPLLVQLAQALKEARKPNKPRAADLLSQRPRSFTGPREIDPAAGIDYAYDRDDDPGTTDSVRDDDVIGDLGVAWLELVRQTMDVERNPTRVRLRWHPRLRPTQRPSDGDHPCVYKDISAALQSGLSGARINPFLVRDEHVLFPAWTSD